MNNVSFISPMEYQFDPTATDPLNLVPSEPHEIASASDIAIFLNNGLFYSESVIIVDQDTNQTLTVGTDYKFLGYDNLVTAKANGNPVASGIQLTDEDYIGTLLITHQLVGGWEGRPTGYAFELIEKIQAANDNRTYDWATQVTDKPSQYPTGPHNHYLQDADDLYLLNQKVNSLLSALINRVPLDNSGNSYQEQIDRLLTLFGSLAQTVSNITAVGQTNDWFTDLANRIANMATQNNLSLVTTTPNTLTLAELDLTEVNSFSGMATLKTDTDAISITFHGVGVVGRDAVLNILDTAYTSGYTATSVVGVLSVSANVVGDTLAIIASSTVAGTIVGKLDKVM